MGGPPLTVREPHCIRIVRSLVASYTRWRRHGSNRPSHALGSLLQLQLLAQPGPVDKRSERHNGYRECPQYILRFALEDAGPAPDRVRHAGTVPS